MCQICFQVNVDLTLVDCQFPLSPIPKRQRKLRISLGEGGWGWKQTQVLCNTMYDRSLGELYSLWLTDHKRFVRWVRRQIIYRIQVQEFSKKVEPFFIWTYHGGVLWKKIVTSLQVCRLKCHCLRKCSRGQKLLSTDLAETWHRSWVWWDISKATLAYFSDFSFWSYMGGLIFGLLSTKHPAFEGEFWKCHKTPLVNCATKWMWPWTLQQQSFQFMHDTLSSRYCTKRSLGLEFGQDWC